MTSPVGPGDVRFHLTVLRCQAGDDRAFADIMQAFEGRTLSYLSALVGDDAEDVQQEVWISVFRNIQELTNPAAFRTWLFRLARHRAIDWLRRQKRERELLEEAALEPGFFGDDADGDLSLDEAALQRIVSGLPPPQREVLLLRYRDDLSYAEIAVVVGLPIGTVRTRIHHAKQKLTAHLKRTNT